MGKVKDLTGQRFGRLVVLKQEGRNSSRKITWLCKCDCGNECVVVGNSLSTGNTVSCGCLRKEVTGEKYRGKTLTEETKKKISCSSKGKQHTEETKKKISESVTGEDNPFYGKHHTEETKRTWSEQRKGKQLSEETKCKMSETRKGENNPNYNPNLTDEDRKERRIQQGYSDWQREVKHQANYTCDICGKRGNGTLHSHHLDSYNSHEERRLDITNGVCLCEHCHRDFHHYYGYGENTEEDYLEYKFAYQNN